MKGNSETITTEARDYQPHDGPCDPGDRAVPNVTMSVHTTTLLNSTTWTPNDQPAYVSVKVGDDLALFLDGPALFRFRAFLADVQEALRVAEAEALVPVAS